MKLFTHEERVKRILSAQINKNIFPQSQKPIIYKEVKLMILEKRQIQNRKKET